MAINNGEIVGDYRVIDLIGSGGMGAVYRVEHLITQRVEAMKVLPCGICGPDEITRFEREIRVQARLHHPNIAALYSAQRHGNTLALIMEYVQGESLQQLLLRQQLSTDVAVNFAGQLLDALAYAHENGVIHRDVSPANVIITPEGVAKLTDFGLAREAGDLRVSSAGVPMGSPWYMSPEQVRGTDQPDGRTDIYSMGSVLHEMLTGRRLFDAEGSFTIMRAHMETVPKPPSAYNRDVPKTLDEAVCKALAKDPAQRFQSAAEFRAAIVATPRSVPSEEQTRPSHPTGARFRKRRVITFILAPTALAAIICTALVWPKLTHRTREAQVVPQSVVPNVNPIEPPVLTGGVPEVTNPAAPPPLTDVPAKADHSRRYPRIRASQPETTSTQSEHRAEHDEAGPRPAAIPTPKASALPPAAAPVVAQPEEETPAPTIAAPPLAVAEPETPTPTAEEPKTQKSGNGLIKALGKLNPFRKRAKTDTVDPPNAAKDR